jgi:hypothetical protein
MGHVGFGNGTNIGQIMMWTRSACDSSCSPYTRPPRRDRSACLPVRSPARALACPCACLPVRCTRNSLHVQQAERHARPAWAQHAARTCCSTRRD